MELLKVENIEFKDCTIEKMFSLSERNLDEIKKMGIEEFSDLVEDEISNYFYVSGSPEDVINAINDEIEIAGNFRFDFTYISDNGLYFALYS